MSPTEFSNYIKQRAIQQQNHHSHNGHNAITPIGPTTNGHLNSIGPVSPARSLSPNPLSVAIMNGSTNTNTMSTRNMPNDSYFFSQTAAAASNGSNINTAMYSPPQYGRNNLFESSNSYASVPTNTNPIASNSSFYSNGYGNIGNGAAASKYSPYIDTSNYYGLPNGQQQQPSNAMNSLGAPSPHINGMTNGHHQTLESNLNTGNINLLVAN